MYRNANSPYSAPMDDQRCHRWQAIYEKYRKVMDDALSLLDDPEAHAAAWREIRRYAGQLEELIEMPTSAPPLRPA
jgi:hypothetical protein